MILASIVVTLVYHTILKHSLLSIIEVWVAFICMSLLLSRCYLRVDVSVSIGRLGFGHCVGICVSLFVGLCVR
jgi:hypothetical protein